MDRVSPSLASASEVNPNQCSVCKLGPSGLVKPLISCAACHRQWHSYCHYPSIIFIPRTSQLWHCARCSKNKSFSYQVNCAGANCAMKVLAEAADTEIYCFHCEKRIRHEEEKRVVPKQGTYTLSAASRVSSPPPRRSFKRRYPPPQNTASEAKRPRLIDTSARSNPTTEVGSLSPTGESDSGKSFSDSSENPATAYSSRLQVLGRGQPAMSESLGTRKEIPQKGKLPSSKKQRVKFLHLELQMGFFSKSGPPNESEMEAISEAIEDLESYSDMEDDIIESTKIDEVLKDILNLLYIPMEEHYRFKERSQALLTKFGCISNNAQGPVTMSSQGQGSFEEYGHAGPQSNWLHPLSSNGSGAISSQEYASIPMTDHEKSPVISIEETHPASADIRKQEVYGAQVNKEPPDNVQQSDVDIEMGDAMPFPKDGQKICMKNINKQQWNFSNIEKRVAHSEASRLNPSVRRSLDDCLDDVEDNSSINSKEQIQPIQAMNDTVPNDFQGESTVLETGIINNGLHGVIPDNIQSKSTDPPPQDTPVSIFEVPGVRQRATLPCPAHSRTHSTVDTNLIPSDGPEFGRAERSEDSFANVAEDNSFALNEGIRPLSISFEIVEGGDKVHDTEQEIPQDTMSVPESARKLRSNMVNSFTQTEISLPVNERIGFQQYQVNEEVEGLDVPMGDKQRTPSASILIASSREAVLDAFLYSKSALNPPMVQSLQTDTRRSKGHIPATCPGSNSLSRSEMKGYHGERLISLDIEAKEKKSWAKHQETDRPSIPPSDIQALLQDFGLPENLEPILRDDELVMSEVIPSRRKSRNAARRVWRIPK